MLEIKVNETENGAKIIVKNITKGTQIETTLELSERGSGMILEGGLLNYTKKNG